jgi:hypothetical protein
MNLKILCLLFVFGAVAACSRPVNTESEIDGNMVSVKRISREVDFPVATNIDTFEHRYLAKVEFRRPKQSLVASQIIDEVSRLEWVRADGVAVPDLRWSIEIQYEDDTLTIYLGENQNYIITQDGVFLGGRGIRRILYSSFGSL